MNALQSAIDSILEQLDTQKLKLSSARMTHAYRQGMSLIQEEELIAYLIVRLPATYAAISCVLKNISPPSSLLDMGAEPGTLFWAAQSTWNRVPPITALEREPTFIDLGKKLGSAVHWKQEDFLNTPAFEPHDWVFFGYSLGELPEKSRPDLLEKCWKCAHQGVIIVEPGTPKGNGNILQARSHLIGLGGFVWAPCPHSLPCPMPPPDWCHFSVRLDRSRLHRQAKMGSLSYEDEKFSYVIVGKTKPTHSLSLVVHSPMHRSGHSLLPLCTQEGLQIITISAGVKKNSTDKRVNYVGEKYS